MKHAKTLLIGFFTILFSSCAFISFEKLNVECNIPDELIFFTENTIKLTFSIAPETKDIENNIKLLVNNATTDCDFTWDNNTCSINPKTGWEFGAVYDFSISNSLHMDDGRTYSVDIRRIFYYGDDAKYLRLEECSIENETVVTKLEPLVFTFNTPVDVLSFKNNFIISPNVTYTLDFSEENKKITITPTEGWKTNARYTWTLSGITSSENYPQKKIYTQTFYAPKDTVKPELLNIHPVSKENGTYNWLTEKDITQVQLNNNLGFIFSEPIDFDTLNNALSFSPNINGYLIQDDAEGTKFIYCIEDFWNPEKEYEMTISNKLQDLNSISLYEDYITYFTPVKTLFEVEKVIINGTEVTEFGENILEIDIEPVIPISVVIQFTKAVTDEYKNKANQITNLNSYFPSTANSPTVIAIQWNDDYKMEITYKTFSESSNDVLNYYLLKISGGVNSILDEFGNYLEEDVCVYFIAR